MLQVNHLYKSYKTGNTTYEVLKDVSFSIEEGEFVKGGPAASGTVTVTRDGDDYTFAVDLADDFGYKITGTFTVTFDNVKQMTIPSDF